MFYRWKAINLFLQSRNQRSIWLNRAALCETSHFLLTRACLINMSYAGFELHCFTFRFSAFYVDAIILFTHTFHRVWSSRRKKKSKSLHKQHQQQKQIIDGNSNSTDRIVTFRSKSISWKPRMRRCYCNYFVNAHFLAGLRYRRRFKDEIVNFDNHYFLK